MKTITVQVVKVSVSLILLAGLFYLTACNSLKTKTEADAPHKETVSTPEPPAMDIHAAAFMGNLKAVKQHIAAGSDINVKEPMGGATPLISAIVFGKTDVALALIDAGANLSLTNNDGSTALHVAAFFCRKSVVEALLAHGADKTLRNNAGATAYESVAAPFADVRFIYDEISKSLGPLGLKLDYAYVERTRPEIAELLK